MRQALLVLALFVAATNTAQAKMPGFSVEVEPSSPVAGEPFVIEVTLEASAPVEVLDGLIAVHPADDPGTKRQITLHRVGDATYRAQVTVDQSGEWVIMAFPDRSMWPTDEVPDGYPDRIPITVQPDPMTAPVNGGTVVLLALGLVMAWLLAGKIV